MRAALAPLAVAPARRPGAARAAGSARGSRRPRRRSTRSLRVLDPEAAASDRPPERAPGGPRAGGDPSRAGQAWSGRDDLWAPDYYHPTVLVGLVDGAERALPAHRRPGRADRRAEARWTRCGASGTSAGCGRDSSPAGAGIRSAIGYSGDLPPIWTASRLWRRRSTQIAAATRRYARRQLTWLRKLRDAVIIDVQDREPGEIAQEILRDRAVRATAPREPHHA